MNSKAFNIILFITISNILTSCLAIQDNKTKVVNDDTEDDGDIYDDEFNHQTTSSPKPRGFAFEKEPIEVQVQFALDEFNSTENPELTQQIFEEQSGKPLITLRQTLLRFNYKDCCPTWSDLASNREVIDEFKRKNLKSFLTQVDLLNELKKTFLNITYLSIDGQSGGSEREQYYAFYDSVNYCLRLLKVAKNYLKSSRTMVANATAQEVEFDRVFKRNLKSIEFKISQDPTLVSFLNELTKEGGEDLEPNFELYEDFIRYTKFGQDYAKNISMIRESVQVFDQIYSHLTGSEFPSNFTRPSKQFEMIQRMSSELYVIRDELVQRINPRVRLNRPDVRRIFSQLDKLALIKPYIRLLGDQSDPDIGDYVVDLTRLLYQYLEDNLTDVSFYDQLSNLPKNFIILGSKIAHDYESKEVTTYSRFEELISDKFKTAYDITVDYDQSVNNNNIPTSDSNAGNLSLLSRFFN